VERKGPLQKISVVQTHDTCTEKRDQKRAGRPRPLVRRSRSVWLPLSLVRDRHYVTYQRLIRRWQDGVCIPHVREWASKYSALPGSNLVWDNKRLDWVFRQSLQANDGTVGVHLMLGHDLFLPHHFQFIFTSTLYNSDCQKGTLRLVALQCLSGCSGCYTTTFCDISFLCSNRVTR
jgi:hypothetical protein